MDEKHTQDEKYLFGLGMKRMFDFFVSAYKSEMTFFQAIQHFDDWQESILAPWADGDIECEGHRKEGDLLLPPEPKGPKHGA